jgi:hypothetical protein
MQSCAMHAQYWLLSRPPQLPCQQLLWSEPRSANAAIPPSAHNSATAHYVSISTHEPPLNERNVEDVHEAEVLSNHILLLRQETLRHLKILLDCFHCIDDYSLVWRYAHILLCELQECNSSRGLRKVQRFDGLRLIE